MWESYGVQFLLYLGLSGWVLERLKSVLGKGVKVYIIKLFS